MVPGDVRADVWRGYGSARNIGTKSHANERRGRFWAGGSADHGPGERDRESEPIRPALALEPVSQFLGRAGAGDPGSERPDGAWVAFG